MKVEAAFKRFDQTGNEKLNFKEFSDMMTKRGENSRRQNNLSEAATSAGTNQEESD